MAAAGSATGHKMAILAYFQSHSEDTYTMVAAAPKPTFEKKNLHSQIFTGQSEILLLLLVRTYMC